MATKEPRKLRRRNNAGTRAKIAVDARRRPTTAAARRPLWIRISVWALVGAFVVGFAVFGFINYPLTRTQPQVVATVNGVKIYQTDVDKRLSLYEAMYNMDLSDPTFKKQVISELIDEELMLQDAKTKGITASAADVKSQSDSLMGELDSIYSSRTATLQALNKHGIKQRDITDFVTRQVTITKLYNQVTASATVTDKEVSDYYNAHKSDYVIPEKVHMYQILLNTKSDADSVMAKLNAGADFAATAKQYSVDTATKDQGGDRGYVSTADIAPELATPLFKLKSGQIAGPIQSGTQWFIIKATDRTPSRQQTLDEVKASIQSDLLNQKRYDLFDAYLKGLHDKATITQSGSSPS